MADYGYARLEAKRDSIWGAYSDEDLALRMRRCLSWLACAEDAGDNADIVFIALWVAFNATYEKNDLVWVREHEDFRAYFSHLIRLDRSKKITAAIAPYLQQWQKLFIDNKFVQRAFWKYQHGEEGGDNWQTRLEAETKKFRAACAEITASKKSLALVLSLLFDRLYVLRNQLMHGGATWQGDVNRPQVNDGVHILSSLIPIFLDLMMDDRLENGESATDWGKPRYPVIRKLG